jgi:hypothetical protein
MAGCGWDSCGWIKAPVSCERGYGTRSSSERWRLWLNELRWACQTGLLLMELVLQDASLLTTILDNVFHTTFYQLSLITNRSKQGCHSVTLLLSKITLITKVYICNMLIFPWTYKWHRKCRFQRPSSTEKVIWTAVTMSWWQPHEYWPKTTDLLQ